MGLNKFNRAALKKVIQKNLGRWMKASQVWSEMVTMGIYNTFCSVREVSFRLKQIGLPHKKDRNYLVFEMKYVWDD